MEVLGYEPLTASEKSLWGRHVVSLREADATPETIRFVAEQYRKQWPGIDLTINSLEKWYSHFLRSFKARKDAKASVCPSCGVGGGMHLSDCERAS